jgi:hypothetical protein
VKTLRKLTYAIQGAGELLQFAPCQNQLRI